METASCVSTDIGSPRSANDSRSDDVSTVAMLTSSPADQEHQRQQDLSSISPSLANTKAQTPPYHQNRSQFLLSSSATMAAVRGKTDPAMAPYVCARCDKNIVDRYLLEALEKYWHEDCLKCDACDGRLGDLGSKFYFKNNNILCQRDYLRIFRPTGTCAACSKTIPAFEQVMKAGANVYHLECFACQECSHRFCIGDKFYLDVTNNKILCEYDYEERMVFAQMAYNYNSLAQLKRQISQHVDEFDEVQSVP